MAALVRVDSRECGSRRGTQLAVQACRCRRDLEQSDAQATFAPTLNPNSRRLAQARKARSLHQSLQGSPCAPYGKACSAFASPRRSLSPGHDRWPEAPDVRACTFAPAVNATTELHLSKAGIPATFEERQEFYRERRAVRHPPMCQEKPCWSYVRMALLGKGSLHGCGSPKLSQPRAGLVWAADTTMRCTRDTSGLLQRPRLRAGAGAAHAAARGGPGVHLPPCDRRRRHGGPRSLPPRGHAGRNARRVCGAPGGRGRAQGGGAAGHRQPADGKVPLSAGHQRALAHGACARAGLLQARVRIVCREER